MLQFIRMVEKPVNAQEDEKSILKKMTKDICDEIALYSLFSKKKDEIMKELERIQNK